MLQGFLGAFALMRLSTWGQRGGWWPFSPVTVGGPPHPPLRARDPARVRRRRAPGWPPGTTGSRRPLAFAFGVGRRAHLRRGGAAARPPRRLLDAARASSRSRSASASPRCSRATLLALRMLRRGEENEERGGRSSPGHGGRHHAQAPVRLAERRPGGGSEPRLGLLAHPDHLVAAGADADEQDRDADVVADRGEVVARLRRQVGLAAARRRSRPRSRAAPRTRARRCG